MVYTGQLLVMGLTLFECITVRSLETGYEYTNEHVERDDLYKDLKCAYLYGGYTHMRVIKHLFGEPYNIKLNLAIGTISNVSDLVKAQVATLIALEEIRIGAMWALLLFSSFITGFYQETKSTPQCYQNVFDSLVYVIGKLHEDLAGCREGNSFDSYDSMLKSSENFGFEIFKQIILKQHTDKAWYLLHKNDIIGDCSLKEKLENNLRPSSLFMHNLGMFKELKEDLKYVYNLRMPWNNTGTILLMAWQNARFLNWKKTNLLHVKSYFKSCYDFLKIIMFRLTLKHMTYLKCYILNADAYVNYVQEWFDVVKQFGTMLNLSEDLHVNNLLNCLRNLIDGIEKIDSVVSYVVVILVTLCKPFGCEAGNPFFIDNQEFTIPYTGLTEEEIKSLQVTFSPVWIEYYSLENANAFLSHLKLVFTNVNFSAIRSLTRYINEINQINYVEMSEDRADQLEHLINMSDFE